MKYTSFFLLLLLFSSAHPFSSVAQSKSSRPNIIFLLVDDMGYADIGSYGSSFYETPNVDKLAGDGMRFLNAYTAGSICSPTRASIMTGRYPVRTGVTDWIPGQKVDNTKLLQPKTARFLKPEEITFAEVLKKGGYATFYAGKWHLGDNDEYEPRKQGFDEYHSAIEMRKVRSRVITDTLTARTLNFIREKSAQQKPFIAFLSYYDVHEPIYDYPDFIDHYKGKSTALGEKLKGLPEHAAFSRQRQDDAQYGSMVGAIDKSVGKITELLTSLGIDKNTVVIFTSDNGGLSTTKRIGPTSNLPFRAGKGWLYDGGVRVPLIIKYPAMVKAGSVNSEPTMSTDFYPTMLQLAGLPVMPQLHKDGLSLLPLLKQSASLKRTDLFWHYPHYHGSTWTPGSAVRSGDWKLIEFYETNTVELFNLKTDPYEKQDVSAQNPQKVKELKNKLENWRSETGAQIPAANAAYDPNKKTTKKATEENDG